MSLQNIDIKNRRKISFKKHNNKPLNNDRLLQQERERIKYIESEIKKIREDINSLLSGYRDSEYRERVQREREKNTQFFISRAEGEAERIEAEIRGYEERTQYYSGQIQYYVRRIEAINKINTII